MGKGKERTVREVTTQTTLYKRIVVVAAMSAGAFAWALAPEQVEIDQATAWSRTAFASSCAATNGVGTHWPFSFVYGGVSSRAFLDAWPCERQGNVLRFRDPEGRLEVDCERVEHPGWPVAEWLLRFRNVSREDTKIIERVRPFDLTVPGRAVKYLVHHAVGSPCQRDDYLQVTTPLKAKPSWEESAHGVRPHLTVRTSGGRSCDAAMPYFNLEGDGAGLIAAIGWGGQWTADFSVSASDGRLRMVAGQEDCRFRLKPGEEVRSPRAVALFWRRDHWLKAQNVWRAWMIARNVHRPDGRLVTHHINGASSYYHGCNTAEPMTAANQKADIDRFLAEGVPLDYWWMDAAWYACERNQWWKTGDWRVDPVRFPKGLREVTDHARAKGVKSIVWFEPERCLNGTPLAKEHPDFLYPGNDPRLLNLGKPDVWNWVVDRFEGFLRSERIDVYRQDFNLPPLDIWRRNDAQEKDRVGISEMKHVDAYHRWFAEILKRDPSRQIDSCSSGGRRNDVETMRTAVPLLRSDFTKDATSQQSQTMGIGIWIPFYGASLSQVDDYSFRSWSTPYLHITADITRKGFDWSALRRGIAQWKKYLAPYFDKDFYPLAPFGVDRTAWAGWQFHDPATDSGTMQLFRRDASPYPVFEVKPFGLDPAKTYRVTDVDTGRTFAIRGGAAFDFRLDRPASAAILHYAVQ